MRGREMERMRERENDRERARARDNTHRERHAEKIQLRASVCRHTQSKRNREEEIDTPATTSSGTKSMAIRSWGERRYFTSSRSSTRDPFTARTVRRHGKRYKGD
jgi:hypothetical protein